MCCLKLFPLPRGSTQKFQEQEKEVAPPYKQASLLTLPENIAKWSKRQVFQGDLMRKKAEAMNAEDGTNCKNNIDDESNSEHGLL